MVLARTTPCTIIKLPMADSSDYFSESMPATSNSEEDYRSRLPTGQGQVPDRDRLPINAYPCDEDDELVEEFSQGAGEITIAARYVLLAGGSIVIGRFPPARRHQGIASSTAPRRRSGDSVGASSMKAS